MALERVDRAPSPRPQPWPHLQPRSKLVTSVSASSLTTAGSRGEESSPYLIRNLSSGEVVDLRDECAPEFPDSFAQITDNLRRISQVRTQWYSPNSAHRSFLAKSLFEAVRIHDLAKVETLLVQGANPSVRFESRWTALHLAAAKGFLDVCSLLCEYTSDLLGTDSKDRTPLHLCTMEGHFLVLQHLLISIHPTSTDLDQVDCEGNTPLHYAARLRDQRAIELLLDHGASSVICNLDGQSPLTLCPDGPGYDLLRDSMERRNKQRDQFAIPRLAGSEPLLSSISLILPSNPLIPASVSLDSFTPLGLLGKGQFGEVFLVQYLPTGQLYAMKSVSKGRDMTQYMRTERNVLARLDHPFIVRLHWAFQTSSNLYLVVDYCPAGDLAELLRNEGKLTEDAAKFFAAEVVLAIEALHNENVVYRDLKPENIVLDLNGHIRLTDFGLAKEMSMSASSHSFCGPLCYFPPEMVREQRHTQAVDWYMLGCLLYEMVVGEPPFKAHDETKLFMKIEQGKVSFPAGISLSNEAKDLIRKLLRVEVVKRLGNAGAEEVKCHPFFTGTDWSLVQAKQCSAPLSTPRKRAASLQGRCAYICKEDRPDRHVDGWTFCRGQ